MIVGVCMSINHPSVLSEWFHPYDVESAKDGCDSGGVDQKNLHYVWGKESKAAQKEKNLTGLINRVFTNGESSIQDPSYWIILKKLYLIERPNGVWSFYKLLDHAYKSKNSLKSIKGLSQKHATPNSPSHCARMTQFW